MIKIAPKYVFILLLSLMMFPTLLTAQEEPEAKETNSSDKVGKAELIISGALYDDGVRLENVALILKEDGVLVSETYSDENGKFKVVMKLDKIFTLHFSMAEYVDKIVEIDTRNVPNDNRKYDFTYKGWRVDMFPLDLDVDYSSLKKPVAIVVYNPAEDGFSTDKKYERSVRPSRERLIKAVYNALDQKDIDSEDAFDDYMLAVKDGDLYLKEGDYESALMQYEAAKEILPNESYPGKQIQKTMALMQANSSIDEQYANHLQAADEAFDNKEWATAQTSYEFAHDVKPKIQYPMDQMDIIRKKIADEKLALAQMKEKEKQATYDAFVSSGDSLMALAKYPESKSKYKEALTVYSKKEYPKTKINEIDLLISKNAKSEQAYLDLLANANKYLGNKEYEKAKESYSEALGIKPNEELPKAKLTEIDALLGGLAALKAKELEMKAQKEAALQAKYDGLIVRADALMVDKEYEKAKADYESAVLLKSNELYPQNQIKLINTTLAELEGVEIQFAKLMGNGLKNQNANKLELAKSDYQAALNLKPDAQEPQDEITKIDGLLAANAAAIAAKQKAIDDEYDGLIVSADVLMGNKAYNKAKADYENAVVLKPKELYPQNQIKLINTALAELEGVEKQFDNLMANGLKNQNANKLELAKSDYQAALNLKPNAQAPQDAITKIDSLLAANVAAIAAKQKAIDDEYDGLIVNADAMMVNKSYEKAKVDYEKAVTLKPKELHPQNQIKLINKTLAELEGVDKQFDKLMASGLKNQNAKKLEMAKSDYQAALNLKPDAKAPQDAITKIDSLLAANAAAIAAKQKAIDDKYDGFIADGDAMMALEKYTEAEEAYKQAVTVKSKEEYPKTQISLIHDKLGVLAAAAAASEKEAKELALNEQKYNALIAKADEQYKSGSYTLAKSNYKEALVVFTGKAYPMSQISEIDSKLALLAAEEAASAKAAEEKKAKEDEYQSIVVKADAAFTSKDYAKARLEYQNAQKVFVDKPYPANQIKKIEDIELAEKQKAEQAALLLAQQAENKEKFDASVAEGDALVAKGELQKGKYKYEAALKLIAGDPVVIKKMRDLSAKIEEERKLAEFHSKNDTEFNKQLAEDYPNGLNETKKAGGKTTTRIVVVGNGRGDEYKKEVYSYGAVFYFKNGKKIDESTFKRETKGH
jgi:tetratricopeptide (TPR) repeat protein